jgi:hypothetical protein
MAKLDLQGVLVEGGAACRSAPPHAATAASAPFRAAGVGSLTSAALAAWRPAPLHLEAGGGRDIRAPLAAGGAVV